MGAMAERFRVGVTRLGRPEVRARSVAQSQSQNLVLLGFIIILGITFASITPLFVSGGNLQNIGRQGAVLAMLAMVRPS